MSYKIFTTHDTWKNYIAVRPCGLVIRLASYSVEVFCNSSVTSTGVLISLALLIKSKFHDDVPSCSVCT